MKGIELHVGHDSAATKARVLSVVGQTGETGSDASQTHVTFESWKGLTRTLSAKRLALLRHLRREPAASVAELARALVRDYKRVHEDVEALCAAGLLERTKERGVRMNYDEIHIVIDLLGRAP